MVKVRKKKISGRGARSERVGREQNIPGSPPELSVVEVHCGVMPDVFHKGEREVEKNPQCTSITKLCSKGHRSTADQTSAGRLDLSCHKIEKLLLLADQVFLKLYYLIEQLVD